MTWRRPWAYEQWLPPTTTHVSAADPEIILQRLLRLSAPTVWNSLPSGAWLTDTLAAFERRFTHFYRVFNSDKCNAIMYSLSIAILLVSGPVFIAFLDK